MSLASFHRDLDPNRCCFYGGQVSAGPQGMLLNVETEEMLRIHPGVDASQTSLDPPGIKNGKQSENQGRNSFCLTTTRRGWSQMAPFLVEQM